MIVSPAPVLAALAEGVAPALLVRCVKSPEVEEGDIGGVPDGYGCIGEACQDGDCGSAAYPCRMQNTVVTGKVKYNQPSVQPAATP